MQHRRLFPFYSIIAAMGFLLVLAVYHDWLSVFFYGADQSTVKGIDYFAVPKSFQNLMEGRSAFDTWGGVPYGPYATWYLAHPAFSVFVASWFSWMEPWTSYYAFAVFSFLLLSVSGLLIIRYTSNMRNRIYALLFILCTFPTYWLLYVGNMHAPLVLALTFILIAFFNFAYADKKTGTRYLIAGLLISFFSKPIVLLMLPLFFLLRETRIATFKSLIIYAVVSLLFILIPFFNPEAIGIERLAGVVTDFDFIRENMNIYRNNFQLNEYMKDNSIHWLNLIAQGEFKLLHIDVFSLPVFTDMIFGKEIPAFIFKLPIWICLILSCLVPLIRDYRLRMETALLLVMAISLTFFLSYNTVWEYQFTSVLPILALLPILRERSVFFSGTIPAMIFAGILLCLPTPYFLLRDGDPTDPVLQTIIRLTRTLPVTFLYVVMVFGLVRIIRQQADLTVIREAYQNPDRIFFEK